MIKFSIYIPLIILINNIASASIIRIPTDFASIQEGIDVSTINDTVLILPGYYKENLRIRNKTIFIGSLFLITNDTSYISNTVIDGQHRGVVIRIYQSNSVPLLESHIIGLTIQNGNGSPGAGIYSFCNFINLESLVVKNNYSPSTMSLGGGGICCIGGINILKNIKIYNNTSKSRGGGIAFERAESNLNNVTICNNSAEIAGGGLYALESNIYFDSEKRCDIYINYSGIGSDFFIDDSQLNTVYLDTFTVKEPTDFHIYPVENIDCHILNYKLEQIKDDLYVSPLGNDENGGLTVEYPLKTINCALSKIYANSANPKSIYLSDGYYSPSNTGEYFQLNMVSNVSIIGIGNNVLLDAERTNSVLIFYGDKNITLYNLHIMGGNRPRGEGGGIICYDSNPFLCNLEIHDNKADIGGGIFLFNSDPQIKNLLIYKNQSNEGGGVYIRESRPRIVNSNICKNYANYGGSIFCMSSSDVEIVNSILWGNNNDIYFFEHYPSSIMRINYSDIEGGEHSIIVNDNGVIKWLDGNIDSDPRFSNIHLSDFYLQSDSPAIDSGDPNTKLDPDGTRTDMGAIYFDQSKLMKNIKIHPCFPNPFNTKTNIIFELPEDTNVKVNIYNNIGQTVKMIVDNIFKSGYRNVVWDGTDQFDVSVGSGPYFINFLIGDQSYTQKVLFIK